MKCPGFEKLIDYLDGRLQTEAADLVASHLASGCEQCAADRHWYEAVTTVAAGDDSTEPPPWVLKRALNLFDSNRKSGSLGERISQAIAGLVFDSMARPAMVGIRSAEAANRQLMYRAGDYSIDVQVMTADQPRAEVIGQVLRRSEMRFESVGGLSLELKCEGDVIKSTTTNDLGEFTLSGIYFGEYDLEVKTPEGAITVVGLPVTFEN